MSSARFVLTQLRRQQIGTGSLTHFEGRIHQIDADVGLRLHSLDDRLRFRQICGPE
jgi:hypothetical protein